MIQLRRLLFFGAAFLLLIQSSAVDAQDNVLRYYYGGELKFTSNILSQMGTGPGLSSVATGGVAPSAADAFQVFRNPAGLRYLYKTSHFGFTFKPPISIELPEDFQTEVNNQINSVTEDFQRAGPFEYPDVTGTVGQLGTSFSSFAFTYPIEKWQFGLGYARLFQLDMDLLLNGLSERIDTIEDDPAEEVLFMVTNSTHNRIRFSADSWVLAGARDIGENTSVGASFSRTYIDFAMDSGYRVDGLMTSGGNVSAFNDDSDPWYNDLQGVAQGGYDGSSYALRLGGQYVPGWEDTWRFGLDVKLATKASMDGDLTLRVDEFPALKLDPGPGEENFDVNRIEDVSELTRTYPNYYLASSTMYVYVPSTVSLGVSYARGWKPSYSFTLYMGKLGYELDIQEKRVFETEYTTRTYAIGFEPVYQTYFSINPGRFFMGFGFTSGTIYSEGHKNPDDGSPLLDTQDIILPRFDLGFTIGIMQGMDLEILVDGLPEDVFRMGLTYEF